MGFAASLPSTSQSRPPTSTMTNPASKCLIPDLHRTAATFIVIIQGIYGMLNDHLDCSTGKIPNLCRNIQLHSSRFVELDFAAIFSGLSPSAFDANHLPVLVRCSVSASFLAPARFLAPASFIIQTLPLNPTRSIATTLLLVSTPLPAHAYCLEPTLLRMGIFHVAWRMGGAFMGKGELLETSGGGVER